ncbi:hypothetical protein ACFVRR_14240 [Gottfriedia sp. NPDC057948]|uniref:hypothetical protein n=1 Tax=Gottfriedia sp. NPDC057948 TaxID=3346287 RepID=UPI0036DD2011
MDIHKVYIDGSEIPFQNGSFTFFNFGNNLKIELELVVHHTVLNFLNTLNYYKERVNIFLNHNKQINGDFEIRTGVTSIHLVSNVKEIEGIENLSAISYGKTTIQTQIDEGIPLDNELKGKPSLLINILRSILENEIKDEGNKVFVSSLLNKLKKGEQLNSFDLYIKDELCYLIEENLTKVK